MSTQTFRSLSFDDVERLRGEIERAAGAAATVEAAAGNLARVLATASASCVLARVFCVVPFAKLPSAERDWAAALARGTGRTAPLVEATPVLTLLGTSGLEPAWTDRLRSAGHRAIPLIDRQFVESAPMIGALLTSLRLDLGQRQDGAVELRTVAGGLNARFLVEDATTSIDAAGRHIIGARAFVEDYGLRSVFGMGGSYVGGELAIAILFTRETLHGPDVDRFTSLISTFKMATSAQLAAGKLFTA